MSDHQPDEDPTPPSVRVSEALETTLHRIDGINPNDSAVERAKQEQQAVEEFVDELAQAVVDGLSRGQAKQRCGVVSDNSEYHTKTALKQMLAERADELETEQSDRRPFDAVLRDDLQEVVIIRTTDAKQDTRYRWEFLKGSLETTATAEGRAHFHWSQFRDEYFDSVGEDAARPIKDLRDGEDWREFVVERIEDLGREVTTRGPRTAAVEDLADFVTRSRAYNDFEAFVERDALYIDQDPRDSDPSELWIHNHDIKRICEDNELSSVRELQIELDARGHTVARVDGVSESTTINGKTVTYWVLDADFADPAEFVPDPVDPAESFQAEQAEQTDGEEDDEDDYEPGAIGAVGGGDDE